ncbi:hypothetical protein BOTCAL_0427g00110 [Botryotinia calthae]|uniref:NAD(P)-binding domain-containing protein n=1 Tax=Botryotinia calthae TaxID=38488 RepID=A0A4Y8CPU5_9HELO|nr:hypothetical protein BOTCAL_0427g00110 [Botryotinia calthae]
MKIIIVGSADILGAELVRQALANPAITSVVAIAPEQRDPLPYHNGDPRLVSLTLPLDVQGMSKANDEAFGSSACIWNVGPTTRGWRNRIGIKDVALYIFNLLSGITWIEGQREEYLKNPNGLSYSSVPFRFVYVSSSTSMSPQKLKMISNLRAIQDAIDKLVPPAVEKSKGRLQSYIVKPGSIVRPGTGNSLGRMMKSAGSWLRDGFAFRFRIELGEIAAALVKVAAEGNANDVLSNKDLIRIGRQVTRDE